MNNVQKNVILVCVIVISVCFVLIQFVIGKKYQDARNNQKTLETENISKKSRLDDINNIRTPLKSLEDAMAQIDAAGLPQGDALPETIEQVESLMKTVDGFTVTSFSPTLTKSGVATSNQTDFTLSLSGDPTKLTNLFNAFTDSIRPMYVKSVIISPIVGSGSVSVALSMVTFNGSGSAATDSASAAPQENSTSANTQEAP